MEKEEPIPDCDSDSSDGLPELFTKRIFEVEKVTKGDIVWALYKGLHWPALVRDVHKKNKKVNVWYLDSPGKCFKVSFKHIHDFFDDNFTKKVKDEAKLHPFGEKHADVLRKANIFAHRRLMGVQDNPLEFFDASLPYFVLHDVDSKISEIKINTDIALTKEDSYKNDTFEEVVEIESEYENDEENCTTTKYSPESYEENNLYDDKMIDKIISYITSGHVDKYLLDIVNSKVTNERHTSYLEAAKEKKIELFLISHPSIPISSHKLHNASIYLNSLYKKKVGMENPKMNEYIVCVWLPEAVNEAISFIETETLTPPDNSCNDNQSPLETEVSNMPNDTFDSSSNSEKLTELLVDSDSANISFSFKVEASESLVHVSSCTPKRGLSSSLVKNDLSNILEIEANKKKFTGKKRKKTQSKASKSRKKAFQKTDKLQEENLLADI